MAALVAEATRVVVARGHEAVSVREIARAVGVSPAAPFKHFEDREDLLRAVALEALVARQARSREAIAAAGPDPLLQFRAIGLEEIRFAIQQPALARLCQRPGMDKPPSTATPEQRAFLEGIAALNRSLVERAQEVGTARKGDPKVIELAGVAMARGLSAMFLDGSLPREGAEELAERVLDVLGHGLR